MGYQLGVDLGTTYSAAAVRRGDVVTMLGLGNRAMQIPSVLYLQPDGSFLVGEAAEARAAAEPDRIAREFKRRLGDPVPVIVGGSPFSAELLTARLLSWVVGVATEREGAAPDQVTVSHPANWSAYKIDLLRQAFTLANLPDVTTCTEPEAAAITYATRQRVPEGGHVAVYDLGGGTFDAAVLRHDGDRFTLVGRPEGIEHLGGVDFDEAVFQHVVRSLGAELAGLDPDDPATIRGLDRLRRDCVVAKETLSTDTEARLSVTIGRVDTVVRLTRSEFEDMIRPALGDTVAATERVLRSAGVEPGQLDTILLVGGSSRIPLISEMLSSAFARPLALDAHPKHEVATGAAWLTGPLPRLAAASPADVTESTYPALAATAATEPHTRAHDPSGNASANPRDWLAGKRVWVAAVAAAVVAAAIVAVVLLTGGGSKPPEAKDTTSADPLQSKSVVAVGVQRPQGRSPLPNDRMLWAATVDGHPRIMAGNADGSDVRPFLPTDGASGPVLSHDRKTVAFVRNETVYLVGSDGKGTRPLFTSNPGACTLGSRPAFSPDDNEIALLCATGVPLRSDLNVYDLSGKLVKGKLVTGHIGGVAFGRGGQLAYWEACENLKGFNARLAIVAESGGAPTSLTGCIGANGPTFSPDGKSLAFAVWGPNGTNQVGNLYVETLATRKRVQLTFATTARESNEDPSWSPNGTQLAYQHGPRDNGNIWVLPIADSKHPTAVSTDDVPDRVAMWSAR